MNHPHNEQFEQTYEKLLEQVHRNLERPITPILFNFLWIKEEATFLGPKKVVDTLLLCLVLSHLALWVYFMCSQSRRYPPGALVDFVLLLNLISISAGIIMMIFTIKYWREFDILIISPEYLYALFVFPLISFLCFPISFMDISQVRKFKRALNC